MTRPINLVTYHMNRLGLHRTVLVGLWSMFVIGLAFGWFLRGAL